MLYSEQLLTYKHSLLRLQILTLNMRPLVHYVSGDYWQVQGCFLANMGYRNVEFSPDQPGIGNQLKVNEYVVQLVDQGCRPELEFHKD